MSSLADSNISNENAMDPEKLLLELQDKMNENGILEMRNDDLTE